MFGRRIFLAGVVATMTLCFSTSLARDDAVMQYDRDRLGALEAKITNGVDDPCVAMSTFNAAHRNVYLVKEHHVLYGRAAVHVPATPDVASAERQAG